jgi:transposase
MGAAAKITRVDHTPNQLRAIAAHSEDGGQALRLLRVQEGTSRSDAARQTGMDRQTLRDWVHCFNESGVDGLIARKPPGQKPRLTPAQLSEPRQIVLKGPDPKVHKVMRWRCVDLRAEVAQRFPVTVNEITIGRWLRKMRLTRLQPRSYHPRKNAEAQEA